MLSISKVAMVFGSIMAAALVASCAPLPPIEEPAAQQPAFEFSECPVIDSRGWKAWIDGMPGPGAVRTLHIMGEVDMPTPGFEPVLVPGPSDRMMPPGQRFAIDATRPDGMYAQVVTPTAVRYQGRAMHETYRSITIGCGGKVLAQIDTIETAY